MAARGHVEGSSAARAHDDRVDRAAAVTMDGGDPSPCRSQFRITGPIYLDRASCHSAVAMPADLDEAGADLALGCT